MGVVDQLVDQDAAVVEAVLFHLFQIGDEVGLQLVEGLYVKETVVGIVLDQFLVGLQVLEQLFPKAVLADYERYAFPMDQIRRLKRHPWAYKLVWFIERCLFKLEKRRNKRKRQQVWD